MATETIDPQQDQGAEDPASANELEALHNLPSAQEPVYDRPGNQPADADAAAGSGGEHSLYKPGSGKDKTDRSELSNQEKAPAGGKTLYKKVDGKSDDESRFGALRRNLFVTHRRRTFAGGGILGTIIGLLIAFTFVQGPLEIAHLSQILQRGLFENEHAAALRGRGLLRYAKTGDFAETRLSFLGSKVYNKALSQMKDQGIEFADRNLRGVPKSMTIDPRKNDLYKDLSSSKQRAAILADYNIGDQAALTKSGGIYKINFDPTTWKGISFARATLNTAIGSLNSGKLQTGLAARYLKKAFDLPSLFHAYEKAKSVAKNKGASVVDEKKKAKQAEEDRVKAETTLTDTPAVTAARSKIRDVLEKNKSTILKFAFAQAVLCSIRGASNAAVTLNRAAIVAPAAIKSANDIAAGAQVQSNQDFTTDQLAATHDSFIDSQGKTIWQGKALSALAGETNPSGPDLPSDLAQAFSDKTTADNIKNIINVKVLGVNITGAAC
ncbi:MAG: hypothetical protein ACRD72_20790, partial [Candidatus Angelobacter sp.]